nr:MAG TPA: hypothetical protein [Caudoviricetes sp.]
MSSFSPKSIFWIVVEPIGSIPDLANLQSTNFAQSDRKSLILEYPASCAFCFAAFR